MRSLTVTVLALAACSSHSGATGDGAVDSPVGDAAHDAPADAATDAGPPVITAALFGLQVNHADPALQMMPGDFVMATPMRIWDTSYPKPLEWPGINTCPANTNCAADPRLSKFDWTMLDAYLARIHNSPDVLYVLGRTPSWASQRGSRCTVAVNDSTCTGAEDNSCDYNDEGGNSGGGGQCETNVDLLPDGTGSNATFRHWVYNLVQHVATQDHGTYAHIAYYEIWNEPYRSQTLWSAPNCGSKTTKYGVCAFNGTYAQLLRMTQDARCIIEGHPDDPITATGMTCATDPDLPAIGLDPTAKIVSASGTAKDPGFTQNELYCSGSGADAPPDNAFCTSGDAGSKAVDVVNTHNYFAGAALPESSAANMKTIQDALSDADRAKPYFDDEGGGDWQGSNSTPYDPDLEETTPLRWFLALWNQGAARAYWYTWDGNGPLWNPKGFADCTADNGCLSKAGTAYAAALQWLVGKTAACTVNGTMWQCNLATATAKSIVMWDFGACKSTGIAPPCDSSKSSKNCVFARDCTTTDVPLPAGSWTDWRDLDTNSSHAIGTTIPVGIKPIMLE